MVNRRVLQKVEISQFRKHCSAVCGERASYVTLIRFELFIGITCRSSPAQDRLKNSLVLSGANPKLPARAI